MLTYLHPNFYCSDKWTWTHALKTLFLFQFLLKCILRTIQITVFDHLEVDTIVKAIHFTFFIYIYCIYMYVIRISSIYYNIYTIMWCTNERLFLVEVFELIPMSAIKSIRTKHRKKKHSTPTTPILLFLLFWWWGWKRNR